MNKNTLNKILDFLLNVSARFIGMGLGVGVVIIAILVFAKINKKQTTQVEVTPSTVVTDTIKCSTFKFEFDNHDYIKFKTADGEHIIHDPACKCVSNKLNNITTVIVNNEKKTSQELNEKLNRMSVQIKNLQVELSKKPQVIYVSKPTPAKPQAKPQVKAKPKPTHPVTKKK